MLLNGYRSCLRKHSAVGEVPVAAISCGVIEKSVQIALNKLNGQLARQYQAIAEAMRYMEMLNK